MSSKSPYAQAEHVGSMNHAAIKIKIPEPLLNTEIFSVPKVNADRPSDKER